MLNGLVPVRFNHSFASTMLGQSLQVGQIDVAKNLGMRSCMAF